MPILLAAASFPLRDALAAGGYFRLKSWRLAPSRNGRVRSPSKKSRRELLAMLHVLVVAAGGAAGALLRYGVSVACVHWFAPRPIVVVGTLSVNVVGCFLIGLFFARGMGHPILNHAALTVGFLGALTTFSSFGLETARFLQTGKVGWAAANVAANMLLGLAAVYAGMHLGRT